MEGKYRTVGSYWRAWGAGRSACASGFAHRLWVGADGRRLPGYTVLIACHAPVAEILRANLRFLGRQDLKNMDRVLIAMDGPESGRLKELEARAAAGASGIEGGIFVSERVAGEGC